MEVYFKRMKELRANNALEARIRFMVQVRVPGCPGLGVAFQA